MSIAFYNGASGMKAYQSALDVTSHNIANVNTYGYKVQRAAFNDLLRSEISTRVEGDYLVGHGVKQEYIDQLMGQSGLDQTGLMLDFAIVGDGYFAVDNRGAREYTRNGAFNLSVQGETATLVTNDGAYVLDRNNNRITIPRLADGSYVLEGLSETLGVHNFPNQFGLIPKNNSRFSVSNNSGNNTLMPVGGLQNQPHEIIQGALEFSAVDLGREMVNVIMSQRAYQMNSRVVQTADQLAEVVNNLR